MPAEGKPGCRNRQGVTNSVPRRLRFSKINIIISVRRILTYTFLEDTCQCCEHRFLYKRFLLMIMLVPFPGEINDPIRSPKIQNPMLEWSDTVTRDVCSVQVWLWAVPALRLTVVLFQVAGSSCTWHTLLLSALNQVVKLCVSSHRPLCSLL